MNAGPERRATTAVTAAAAVLGGPISLFCLANDRYDLAPASGVLLVSCLAAFAISLLGLRKALNNSRLTHLPGLVLSVATVLAVWQPARTLQAGRRVSVLRSLGFSTGSISELIPVAENVFASCMWAFVVGECVISLRKARFTSTSRNWTDSERYGPRLYLILAALGVATLVARGGALSNTFSSRGQQQGFGILALAGFGVPVAAVVGICCRHWGRKDLALGTGLLSGLYIVLSGTRTPLIIVGVALLMRLALAARGGRAPFVLLVTTASTYIAAAAVIAISNWRSAVAAGQNDSLVAEITRSLREDPIGALAQQGHLDTVDGLILSLQAPSNIPAVHWWDPAKAILNFTPHQLWPGKPEWLGSIVSHNLTDFGGHGGIFLSGPGYARIVWHSTVAAPILFFALGLISSYVLGRSNLPLTLRSFFLYFVIRFTFGGDAFDLFNALNLALLFGLAVVLDHVLSRISTKRNVSSPNLNLPWREQSARVRKSLA